MSAGLVLTSNSPPHQPTFQVVNSSNSNGYFSLNTPVIDVTGDGTTYTILYDTTNFQNGSDISYNSGTGVFTINTTGVYNIELFLSVRNLGVAHLQLQASLSLSTIGGPAIYANPYAMSNQTTNQQASYGSSVTLSLTSTNTFKVIVQVSGSTKTVTASGNTGSPNFNDSNYLSYSRVA